MGCPFPAIQLLSSGLLLSEGHNTWTNSHTTVQLTNTTGLSEALLGSAVQAVAQWSRGQLRGLQLHASATCYGASAPPNYKPSKPTTSAQPHHTLSLNRPPISPSPSHDVRLHEGGPKRHSVAPIQAARPSIAPRQPARHDATQHKTIPVPVPIIRARSATQRDDSIR